MNMTVNMFNMRVPVARTAITGWVKDVITTVGVVTDLEMRWDLPPM